MSPTAISVLSINCLPLPNNLIHFWFWNAFDAVYMLIIDSLARDAWLLTLASKAEVVSDVQAFGAGVWNTSNLLVLFLVRPYSVYLRKIVGAAVRWENWHCDLVNHQTPYRGLLFSSEIFQPILNKCKLHRTSINRMQCCHENSIQIRDNLQHVVNARSRIKVFG